MQGKLDLAFMRPEAGMSGLDYRFIVTEPIAVVLPTDHRLASREAIGLQDIVGETFLSLSNTAPTLQAVIDDYLERSGVDLRPTHRIDNLGMAMSLIASMRGVALLPSYIRNFLPRSVISRPLEGDDQPAIDLVAGFSKTNVSAILELFLFRLDTLISRCWTKSSDVSNLRSNGKSPSLAV
jgi:LysR family hca operon transcriptional activator